MANVQIDGHIALVTGAASGLGKGAANALSAAGATVVGFDVVGDGRSGELIAAPHGPWHQLRGDVSDATAVQEAIAAIVKRFGRLDVAINCAGIPSAKRTLSKGRPFPIEEWDRVIAVNLTGTFHVIRFAAAAMAQGEPDRATGERGVIINVASAAAEQGQVGQSAYSASKAGVVGLTLPVARDLADYAIRVVTVSPGLFETGMAAGLPEVVHALEPMVLYPSRPGRPEEFGCLVRHIIENEYLNATTINLDAGIRISTR